MMLPQLKWHNLSSSELHVFLSIHLSLEKFQNISWNVCKWRYKLTFSFPIHHCAKFRS